MKKSMLALLVSSLVLTSAYGLESHLSTEQSEALVQHIEENNIEFVTSIINKGFDINTDLEGDGTALIIASRNDHKTLVQALLDLGADVNHATQRDGTALTAATISNNVEIAKLLYLQGAELDLITEYDETALINASRYGHFKLVSFLVENGADVNLGVNAKTAKGIVYRSPLKNAKTQKIRDYLILNGAQS
ncbi:MAG: ankyrin repeat domain-containing protein [Colwelliaceae bacterium]|jgi:ankyrin repeat protein|nr:ankyrin repeat domain-containing protein [Colwelliaceae bacterium]